MFEDYIFYSDDTIYQFIDVVFISCIINNVSLYSGELSEPWRYVQLLR